MAKKVKGEQFLKASQILKDLRGSISREDRIEAIKEFKLSEVTVGAYLNGHARNLDTAERLIIFFRGRINRRAEVFTPIN